jgi:pimeloyl-ACP methyl ester carboxylesterase
MKRFSFGSRESLLSMTDHDLRESRTKDDSAYRKADFKEIPLLAVENGSGKKANTVNGDGERLLRNWNEQQQIDGDETRISVNDINAAPPEKFCASWPSPWDRFMHYFRPAMDIYVISAMFLFMVTPNPASSPDVDSWWKLFRTNSALFFWLPFLIRFCHGFLHWVISIIVLPGQLIYHQGPLAPMCPAWILRTINESNALLETYRPRLLLAGGLPIRLVCPDGVVLDALYFRAASPVGEPLAPLSGPTAIRFNGNAEAMELQDPDLPRMYTSAGVSLLVFNYRGVAGSRAPPLWGSALAGWVAAVCHSPPLPATALDAWTVLDYATRGLGVPPARLVLVGHSIGGAIATRLAAAAAAAGRPPPALCSSRSFASLRRLAVNLAPTFAGAEDGSARARWMRAAARALLAASGWEFDAVRDWDRAAGFKWLEYSRADHIIPHTHSLHAALLARPAPAPAPLAIELEALRDADNHNRLLLPTEAAQHVAMLLRAVATPLTPLQPAPPLAPSDAL